MNHLTYSAPELQPDGTLEEHRYSADGDEQQGWQIQRDDTDHLKLGAGYTAVTSKFCGVCSTDLARHFLPYPLPQIIGHEVVAEKDGKYYAIEINASERARGIENTSNAWSHDSMHTQDPERITLGINQLPGGFAPTILAPIHALIPIPANVNPKVAALTEPFAAALQAVEATTPRSGETIAVLGPRRLGSLIIAALAGYRSEHKIDFKIVALARHENLLKVCNKIGADQGINLLQLESAADLDKQFDVIFDTTGNPAGFELALKYAKRAVHLKSTNGQTVQNLQYLTDMVVDELALLPYNKLNLDFTWPVEILNHNTDFKRPNLNIFVTPEIDEHTCDEISSAGHLVHQCSIQEASKLLFANGPLNRPEILSDSPFPRFDLAVTSSLMNVDQIVRPIAGKEWGLVRARGAILLKSPVMPENRLTKAIAKDGLELHTSRCGSFERALNILARNPEITKALEDHLITHTYPLSEIKQAFTTASDSKTSIKVIVECN